MHNSGWWFSLLCPINLRLNFIIDFTRFFSWTEPCPNKTTKLTLNLDGPESGDHPKCELRSSIQLSLILILKTYHHCISSDNDDDSDSTQVISEQVLSNFVELLISISGDQLNSFIKNIEKDNKICLLNSWLSRLGER